MDDDQIVPVPSSVPIGRGEVCVLLVEVLEQAMHNAWEEFPAFGPHPCLPALSGDLAQVMTELGRALGPRVEGVVTEWLRRKSTFDAAVENLEALDHTHRPAGERKASLLSTRIAELSAAREDLDQETCELRKAIAQAIDVAGQQPGHLCRNSHGNQPVSTENVDQQRWPLDIRFHEDENRTRADAHLRLQRERWHARGRSRRNPIDPDVPIVGEKLAAARALSDLARQLERAAYESLDHPVQSTGP